MRETEKIICQTFDTVTLMRNSSTNWTYDSVYKLLPEAFEGENNILFFPTLQLSYGKRSGGIMYETVSPKGMISVGIVHDAQGKFCFGNAKLKSGDMLIFDDAAPSSLITDKPLFASTVSIPKKTYRRLTQALTPYLGKVLFDKGGAMAKMMEDILEQAKTDETFMQDEPRQKALETELINHLNILIETQTPHFPKLTKGEKIALTIRDRIYHEINGKVTIASLAEEFGVSEQTLQNAFKSLFGFTPNRFIRHLKLNHVRKELIEADPAHNTIVNIANRWGFTHMGHFSRYYTELFGENPSVTLQRPFSQEEI